MGGALCTGLALGSPDFILEPTRRAGILLRGLPGKHKLLPCPLILGDLRGLQTPQAAADGLQRLQLPPAPSRFKKDKFLHLSQEEKALLPQRPDPDRWGQGGKG